MRQGFTAILSAILTAAVPTLLFAKGETVKITIESPALAAPIEITDPAVRQFNIWSGPGTYVNGAEGRNGFIIDWASRIDEAPVGLHHYKVSFYEGCESNEPSACRTTEPSLAYVVSSTPSRPGTSVLHIRARDRYGTCLAEQIHRLGQVDKQSLPGWMGCARLRQRWVRRTFFRVYAARSAQRRPSCIAAFHL